MKKILSLTLTFSLFLTACGSSDQNETTQNEIDSLSYYSYETPEFSLEVPQDWTTVNNFGLEFPEEIRVAFKNNIKDSGFTANISVHREEGSITSNLDFAQEKLQDHSETLIDFELQGQEQVTLKLSNADSVSSINRFEGKNKAEGNTLNFMQTYLVSGEKAWTVTASYRNNEDPFVVEAMEHTLSSFTLN